MPPNESDLLSRWAGTRLALQGQDPYSYELIRKAEPNILIPQPFFYPATFIVLLTPLASFSAVTASLIFLSLVAPLLVLSLWMIMSALNLPSGKEERVVVLAACLFSWTLVWGLRMVQPTLLVAALVFLSWFLLVRRHQIAPGILLALATIKPQLVLPLLLWLLLWAVVRRRWTFIAAFSATLGLLLWMAERIVPGWFARWQASLGDFKTIGSTARPLEHLFGHLPGLILTLLLTAAAGVVFWRLRRCHSDSPQFSIAMSLALAVALCAFPTQPLMIYNNILLFPAILLLIFQKPRGQMAALIRFFAIGQLLLDFAFVPLAVLGDAIWQSKHFYWPGLPFLDFFLPLLAGTFLILQVSLRSEDAPAGSQEWSKTVPAKA